MRGIAALSLGNVVNLAGQLMIVPVAMYAWGPARYGEWLILTAFISLLKITDLGLQTFVVNRLCQAYAHGNRGRLRRVLHSALLVQCPLAVSVLVVVAICALSLPLQRMLALQTIGGIRLAILIVMLATEILIWVPLGIVTGIYRATERLPRAAMIGNCQQFAIMGATIAVIALRGSFIAIAACRLMVLLLLSIWVIRDLHELHPWLDLWPSSGSWRHGLRMVLPSVFFLLVPVASYLSNELMLIIVQTFLSGSAVSRFGTHRTVFNSVTAVSATLTIAIWPEVTAMHARKGRQQLAKLHNSVTRANAWLVALATTAILILLPLVYGIWTAKRLTLDAPTAIILAARTVMWGFWSSSMMELLAINRQRPVSIILLAAALLSGVLAVLMVPQFGIRGAALALLAGDACGPAWIIPMLACREIGENPWSFVRAAILKPALGMAMVAGVASLCWVVAPSPALHYFVLGPAVLAIVVLTIWSQLESDERVVVGVGFQRAYQKLL